MRDYLLAGGIQMITLTHVITLSGIILVPFLVWLTKGIFNLDKKVGYLEQNIVADRARIHERINSRPKATDILQLQQQIEKVQHNQEIQGLEIINVMNKMYTDIQLLLAQQQKKEN